MLVQTAQNSAKSALQQLPELFKQLWRQVCLTKVDGGIRHNAQDTGGVSPAAGQHQQGSERHTLLSVGVGEPPCCTVIWATALP
jgi:hypothetical protein